MATDITIRFEDPHDADAFLHSSTRWRAILGIPADSVQILDIASDTLQNDASGRKS